VETPLEPSLLEIRRLPEVLGECGVALDRFQYRVNIAFVIVNSVKKNNKIVRNFVSSVSTRPLLCILVFYLSNCNI